VDPKILSTVKLCIPGPGSVLRRTDIMVILVEGSVNDYAAYIGAGRDPDWVRKYGNKMTFGEACCFFPSMALQESRYRK
jgi:hypothetical protein